MQHPTNNKKTLTKVPQSWADFWNVKDFPGSRALRNDPMGTPMPIMSEVSMSSTLALGMQPRLRLSAGCLIKTPWPMYFAGCLAR
jgi:hypothetical protein